MKPWRLQTERDARERSGDGRTRLRSRPVVESLEGRTLLSTARPAHPRTVPAAYKPPTPTPNRFPPYSLDSMIESPTAGGGSNSIFEGNVAITGSTHAYSVVWLSVGTKPGYFLNFTQANIKGQYTFVVPVGYGSTVLQLFAEDAIQDYSSIEQLTVNRGNPVEAWDAIALQAINASGLAAPEAARDLAVLHSAQYDAVANATKPGDAYQVHIAATKGASAEAAANSAAATVLTELFPSQASMFTAAEGSALAGLPATPATTAGNLLGIQVANQTLANRVNDGSSVGPALSTDNTPQFARVTPFVISSGSAFRPPAPPSPGSAIYDQALAEVSALGRVSSTTRTPRQTSAALFWNGGSAASPVSDPVHWNAIAEQVSLNRKDSLLIDARLFAELDFAMADAAITASDAQTTYQERRPASAIPPIDPTFAPLLLTPPPPSYVSDQATYASAASKVLSSAIGPNLKFTDNSEAASGVTRSFSSFDAAATEDGQSRVWGGANFSFDVQAGATLGTKVAQAVLAGFPRAK